MSDQTALDKNSIDVSRIFETYIAMMGDVDRVAAALDLQPTFIKNLATCEGWTSKLKHWNTLASGDTREVQVQINRAVNFVQAHRLRSVLDKLVGKLHSMTPNELIETLTVQTKFGDEVKTRALTDLVKAAEACQLMTQRALGDTAAEERPKADGNSRGSDIMLAVAAAMTAANQIGLDSEGIVRQQLELPTKLSDHK